MNASHTPFSLLGSWLQRLAMLAAGFAVATISTAGSVSITGTVTANCPSWTAVSGDGTNISYTCGTPATTTGGTFTLTVPSSLAIGTPYPSASSNISISRAVGSNGVTTTVDIGGTDCTPDVSQLTWTGAEASTKGIGVMTGSTATCSISMTLPAGAVANGGTSKSIGLVNPDANVAFAYELSSIPNTNFGAAPTTIKVKRSGGTNGSWTLPVTIGPAVGSFLSNAAAGTLTATAGTPTLLSFPAGSSEASIVFTPVAAAPAGFVLPADGSVTLGTPAPGTIPSGQLGTVTGNALRSFQMVVLTGCPAVANLRTFVFQGTSQPTFPSLQPGQIATYAMPTPMATAGYVSIIQSGGTSQGTDLEIWFSTCPGDVTSALRTQPQTNVYGVTKFPCKMNYNYTGGPIYWSKNSGAVTICHLPDSGGPYYVNFRHVKISGGANSCNQSTCPNVGQFNNTIQ